MVNRTEQGDVLKFQWPLQSIDNIQYLVLPETLRFLLASESQRIQRRERCAVLLGNPHQSEAVIQKVVFLRNIARSQNRFEVFKRDILETSHSENMPLLGIYHSHLVSESLSSADLRSMKNFPLIWLIGFPIRKSFDFQAFIFRQGVQPLQLVNKTMEEEQC